jgi:pyruvate dehydrogenase E2 component (dihydrolipoamide acetyltransferase)
MPVPVTVPRATISMDQGKIIAWLKRQGETVEAGETIFELETDKALLEVPAPAGGVLLRVLVAEGDAAVDSVVGWIGQPGESVPQLSDQTAVEQQVRQPSNTAAPQRSTRRDGVPATPAARRRASELNIDLASVTGTGPGGRITQDDVEAASRRKTPESRTGVAAQVALSWRTVPHIHICRRLDADHLVHCRNANSARGEHVTLTDLLLFASARVLRRFLPLCSTWDGEALKPAERINIAFAVDAGDTVLTPVIDDADALPLDRIAAKRRALADAAREKRLSGSGPAVFTVTNLGTHGVDLFAPVIHFPQTAILATGRVTQEPVVRDGNVTAGWVMWANLAVDHRVSDGATAARFLEALELEFCRLEAKS